jgi:nucleolar GTP-binding protein
VTRANVEVQPYAFTTKSLYVGHMDYKYLRWQAIDTPGILDHSLSERNTIEMQAVTALAHLHCSILFFVDVSEQCGYTIEQQCSLFRSIKPLFASKPLFLVANKIDQVKYQDVPLANREMIEACAQETGAILHQMSNASEEGLSELKIKACDKLLEQRVQAKVQGKKVDSVLNRLTVAYPKNYNKDGEDLSASTIPQSVLDMEESGVKPARERKTQKEIQQESGGPGVYAPNYSDWYKLKNDEWKTDIIPEIMDGKNIADFIDPDILEKLEALEREEEALEAADMDVESEDEDEARTKLVKEIRRAKTLRVKENLGKGSSRAQVPRKALGRSVDEFKEHLDRLGVESRHIAAAGKKRERSASRGRENLRSAMDEVGASRMTRSQSRGDGEGDDDVAAKRRKRSKSRDTLGMKEEDVAVTRTLMKKKVRRGRKLLYHLGSKFCCVVLL